MYVKLAHLTEAPIYRKRGCEDVNSDQSNRVLCSCLLFEPLISELTQCHPRGLVQGFITAALVEYTCKCSKIPLKCSIKA